MNENAKKIWITGASSGIGRALAVKFAKEGWQVAASARRENLLKDLNNKNQNKGFRLDLSEPILMRSNLRLPVDLYNPQLKKL